MISTSEDHYKDLSEKMCICHGTDCEFQREGMGGGWGISDLIGKLIYIIKA